MLRWKKRIAISAHNYAFWWSDQSSEPHTRKWVTSNDKLCSHIFCTTESLSFHVTQTCAATKSCDSNNVTSLCHFQIMGHSSPITARSFLVWKRPVNVVPILLIEVEKHPVRDLAGTGEMELEFNVTTAITSVNNCAVTCSHGTPIWPNLVIK